MNNAFEVFSDFLEKTYDVKLEKLAPDWHSHKWSKIRFPDVHSHLGAKQNISHEHIDKYNNPTTKFKRLKNQNQGNWKKKK